MNLIMRCLFWIAVSFFAAVVGGIGTAIGLGQWYDSLNKPGWTPPSWIFGPVWTTLYTLMGISMGWMDWKTQTMGDMATNRKLRKIFGVQITLNMLWPIVFFGAGQLWLAVPIIVMLEVVIIYWLVCGLKVQTIAAMLIVPYIVWVGFASCLNATIAYLN